MSIQRQVVDIQVKADDLINSPAEIQDYLDFGKYVHETKSYLLDKYHDDFLRKLINEIPELNESTLKPGPSAMGILTLLSGFMGGSFYLNQIRQKQKGKELAHTIKGKFASIGFVLKNNE